MRAFNFIIFVINIYKLYLHFRCYMSILDLQNELLELAGCKQIETTDILYQLKEIFEGLNDEINKFKHSNINLLNETIICPSKTFSDNIFSYSSKMERKFLY